MESDSLPPALREGIEKLDQARATRLDFTASDGKTYHIAKSAVPGTEYRYYLAVQERALTASSDAIWLTLLGSVASLLVLAYLASMLISRKIAKPLAKAEEIEASSRDLFGGTDRMRGDIGAISSNVGELNRQAEEQSASVSETSSTIHQIARNIDSLSRQIGEQSAGVTESSASIQQMASNINSITGNLERAAGGFEALRGIQDVTIQIRDGSLEMNSGASMILKEMGRLEEISLKVMGSTQDIAKSSEAIAGSIKEALALAERNSDSIVALNDISGTFRL